MKELVFEKKKQLGKRSRCHDASIFVSISKNSKKARLTYYNKWADAISKSGYVVIAVNENKMYFKEANETDGWIMSKTKNDSVKVSAIQNDNIYKWIEDGGIGTYEFKHDDELDLYYIEKMKFEKKK